MIKVIAFDFAGVIVYFPLRSWFEKHNFDKNIYKEVTKKWDRGDLTLDESFALLSEKIGVAKDSIYDEVFKNTPLNQGVVQLIKELKKQYQVVLFSNNSGELVRRILAENNITHIFDHLFISSEHKLVKPEKAYFKKLIDTVNVGPSEIVFIDDAKEFVDAGNNIGIHSLLFSSVDDLKDKMIKLGVTV